MVSPVSRWIVTSRSFRSRTVPTWRWSLSSTFMPRRTSSRFTWAPPPNRRPISPRLVLMWLCTSLTPGTDSATSSAIRFSSRVSTSPSSVTSQPSTMTSMPVASIHG